MGQLSIERLGLSDPELWNETVGQPVANQGGATVPAIRTALRHAVTIPTFAPDGQPDQLADRLRLRRQLRALLNNLEYKLLGVYLAWTTDPENSGVYVPDQGQAVSGADETGLATGWFKVESFVFQKLAAYRTHRRAVYVYAKDRRLGTVWRDYWKTVYSTDFAGLTALTVTYLPAGTTDAVDTTTGNPVPVGPTAGGTTSDGGQPYLAAALTDLARVSFEQGTSQQAAEQNMNLADVVVYDRRGNTTANPNP